MTIHTISNGTPDTLDLWLAGVTETDLDTAWGEWFEQTFDPDADPWLGW